MMSSNSSTICFNSFGSNVVSTFGERLLEAFETTEISVLARKLDVSYQAAKNYVQGRIPSPETLIEISNSTGCSLDWLLTGKKQQNVQGSTIRPEILERLKTIAHEQAPVLFRNAQIAGQNVEELTLIMLTDYFLDQALLAHNLTTRSLLKRSERDRIEKMDFVASREKSIEEKFRQIVIDELENRLNPGDDSVTIEDADLILAPVIAHVGDEEDSKLRKTG